MLRGTSDATTGLEDLRELLRRLGFAERICGDHHIGTRNDVAKVLNLQPKGAQAKPYRVKQLRKVILGYGLAEEIGDEE